MNPQRDPESILGPYRVLDLTDEKGFLCGKFLGDLGADVIKIEPPGGHPARNLGPFYQDIPDPNKSLYWFAYNVNKRGITLDVESQDGQGMFKRLVESADFVVESYEPGYMESLGLGYEVLSRINPRIILTSITSFGQFGPYSQYLTSDLINMAMGGHMYVTGYLDRAPVRVGFPVTYCHAGAEGAAASMIAHYHRERTGEGQHVDVSMQECIVWTLMNTTTTWDLNQTNVMRSAGGRANPQTGTVTRALWRCKDGYITFGLAGGGRATAAAGGGVGRPGRTRSIEAMVSWVASDGMADALLRQDWDMYDAQTVTPEEYEPLARELEAFFLTKTTQELYERAVRDRMLLAPVCSAKDILESAQLQAREFFVEVDHPELGTKIVYPTAFVKTSVASPRIYRRGPLIGEHNLEVYQQELGYTQQQMATLREAGVI